MAVVQLVVNPASGQVQLLGYCLIKKQRKKEMLFYQGYLSVNLTSSLSEEKREFRFQLIMIVTSLNFCLLLINFIINQLIV